MDKTVDLDDKDADLEVTWTHFDQNWQIYLKVVSPNWVYQQTGCILKVVSPNWVYPQSCGNPRVGTASEPLGERHKRSRHQPDTSQFCYNRGME